jgi:hypothetical protein
MRYHTRLLAVAVSLIIACADRVVAESFTFRDPTHKFEISYPSDWTRKDAETSDAILGGIEVVAPDDSARCLVYITKLSGTNWAMAAVGSFFAGGNTSEAMFDSWTESDWKDVFDFMSDAKVQNLRDLRMKDGKLSVAAEIFGTYNSSGTAVNMQMLSKLAYARNAMYLGQCVVASVDSTKEDWERLAPVFGEIMNSFDVQSD